MNAQAQPRGGFISRQVALGFLAVSVVAVVMCAMLLSIIDDVSDLVAGMRHDETSIQQGLDLATSVRDLALEMERAMSEGASASLDGYDASRRQALASIAALESRLPKAEHHRLSDLARHIEQLHGGFGALRAAQVAGEDVSVRRLALIERTRTAGLLGDALARAASHQMMHAHVQATDSTRLGLIIGVLCIALVLCLSVVFTLRLRRVVVQPLLTLGQAARLVGQGDFSSRVGLEGRGELADLGQAFDAMADELARREKSILQSERMAAIGQLAAGIAHELNNPIGIIRGYLKTMSPEEDAEMLREELAILDEEAGHCQRIAHDLLAYARADQLDIAPVAMGAMLAEVARRFVESDASRGVSVEVEVESGIAMADHDRVRQVVLNLLTNAAQASQEGAAIELKGEVRADHYAFEVRDRGPGVAVEDRPRVFEPFFTRRRDGSGLGLAVCEGIIKGHRGQISLRPNGDRGTIFEVRLPTQVEESAT
ncbi:MAG: ATP-binding protein [Bradymonadia bacterium]